MPTTRRDTDHGSPAIEHGRRLIQPVAIGVERIRCEFVREAIEDRRWADANRYAKPGFFAFFLKPSSNFSMHRSLLHSGRNGSASAGTCLAYTSG